MDKAPCIVCIGLANVDVIADVSDAFLSQNHISKGVTNRLDAASTGTILSKIKNPAFSAGGCAANTASGIAYFGLPVRFAGKVGEDIYGRIFRDGFAAQPEIAFDTPPYPQKMTSLCLTLVTPDKERTFALCTDTAGWYLGLDDLPASSACEYFYIEANSALIRSGGRSLLEEAAEYYRDRTLILNLNDREIVAQNLAAVSALLRRTGKTFFIGNVGELQALFETGNAETAFRRARETDKIFAITNGADGAYLIGDGAVAHIEAPPLPASRIVNTVGAGDQFAGGFLAGLITGMDLQAACRQGVAAASDVIQQMGARLKSRKPGSRF